LKGVRFLGSKTVHARNKSKYEAARQMREQKISIVQIAKTLKMSTHAIYKWTAGIKCPYHNPRYNTACINNEYFSRQNLAKYPERFVIVGFIAADGCIRDCENGQSILCFNISQKDGLALEIINHEIAAGQRKISVMTKTNSCSIAFPSSQICKDLGRFGIVPRKTKHFKMPKLTKLQMRYFLRGYFYGDGCAYCPKRASHRMYQFVGTAAFIERLSEYLVKHNIVPSAPYYAIGGNGYKQMHIKGSKTAAFGKYLFSDSKIMLIPRKHKLLLTP